MVPLGLVHNWNGASEREPGATFDAGSAMTLTRANYGAHCFLVL